jgi:hypothetical protein
MPIKNNMRIASGIEWIPISVMRLGCAFQYKLFIKLAQRKDSE